MAVILDGQSVATAWRAKIHHRVNELRRQGIVPGLAVILVGNDPASLLYTAMKEKASRAAGMYSRKMSLPEETSTEEVIGLIQKLNQDQTIHGILIQLPLPQAIDTHRVLEALAPYKDADGLHPLNLGKLLIGEESIVPATPKGIFQLLEAYGIETEGRHVVIVGRSMILGKPLAAMFVNRNATVTICHSKTLSLKDYTQLADILVMDTGISGLLDGDMVTKKTVVIDAGITKNAVGEIVGDVVFAEVVNTCRAITPVPGGVGPMTIAALLENTIELTQKSMVESKR